MRDRNEFELGALNMKIVTFILSLILSIYTVKIFTEYIDYKIDYKSVKTIRDALKIIVIGTTMHLLLAVIWCAWLIHYFNLIDYVINQ